MSFPETQPTLMLRLARGGTDADWQQFLADYWGPLVRFAARCGQLPTDQAEDVVSEVFVLLIRSPLIARWQHQSYGKLRGLLCSVVRKILANRHRVERGRRELLRKVAAAGGLPEVLEVSESAEPSSQDLDAFYRAWVDELLALIMRQTLAELHAEGRGDYFRALYGQVCEKIPVVELARAWGVPASTVENQLRVAKTRLARHLRDEVWKHVERYSTAEQLAEDFELEWRELQAHLRQFGGLDEAIRLEALSLDSLPHQARLSASYLSTSAILRNAATNAGGDDGGRGTEDPPTVS